MIHFRQHFPGYFTGYEPLIFDAENTEQLLAHEIMQGWAKNPKFHRWSYSPPETSNREGHLMAEVEGGSSWWVVGYLSGTAPDLPLWDAKKTKPKVFRF